MNNLCELTAYLDTFRKITGKEPDQNAVNFFKSYQAAQDAVQRMGKEARRRSVQIRLKEFKSAMPEDAHPEIVNDLYAAFVNA